MQNIISLLNNALFKNVSSRQIVFKNTFWLGFAEVVSRLLEFVLIVSMIRILGVTEFGKFTFALSFVSIFIIILELGISDITTRDLASNKELEKEYNTILSLKVILSAITLVLITVTSLFITSDPIIRNIIIILGVFVLINEFFSFISTFLRAHQKMEFEAVGKILRSLFLLIFVSFTLYNNPSIQGVSYGYLVANIAIIILILIFFHFKIHRLQWQVNTAVWKRIISVSWPLGLATIFGACIVNGDSVIMGYLGQITENGWYNASRRLTSAMIMVSTFIFISFYPLLSRLFNESLQKLQTAWNYYLEAMILLAVPTVIGGYIFAGPIIEFVFGPNFEPSVIVFRTVIFVVGILFLYHPYHLLLIVSHEQKKIFWIYLLAFGINTLLNLLLIPQYSLYGAAASLLITYIILFCCSIVSAHRLHVITVFNNRLLKVLILSAVVSVALFIPLSRILIYTENVLHIIGMAGILYGVIFFAIYRFSYNFITQ